MNPPNTPGTPPSWHQWRGTGCILVIDDDNSVRIVLSRALARLGFTTCIAADGFEGVTLYNANPARFALVLLDFKLPGMDSGAVFREIRTKRADLPVVLMSGYNRSEAVESADGMDLAGFVHKPFTLELLTTELRSALGA